MPRYIAFLRAINVGGHTVKMDLLRTSFMSLGFSNVETFIARGNVVFESPAKSAQTLEKKIESHLQKSLGDDVRTFIRSSVEKAVIAQYRPCATSELDAAGNSLYIAVLPAPPRGEAKDTLMAFRTKDDDFHVNGHELCWLYRTKMTESAFTGAILENLLGMPATMRNATTVRKLSAKYPV